MNNMSNKREFFTLVNDEKAIQSMIATQATEWNTTTVWATDDVQNIAIAYREMLDNKLKAVRKRMDEIRDAESKDTMLEWRVEFYQNNK